MERSEKINTSLLTGAIGFSLLVHIAVAISVMNIEIPKVTTREHFENWVKDISPPKRKAVILPLPPSVKVAPATGPMVSGQGSLGGAAESAGGGTGKEKVGTAAPSKSQGGGGSGGGNGLAGSARAGALRSSGVLGLIGSKGGGGGDVGGVFSEGAPVAAEGKGKAQGQATMGFGGGPGTGISRQGLKGSDYGSGSGRGPADINQIATESSGRVESGHRQGSALPAPRVTGSGGSAVSGNVDSQGVLGVIVRKNTSFTRCYERSLKSNPDLAGKLGYEISVSEEGHVLDVKFVENTLRSSEVADCVKSILQRLTFPKPKGGPAIFSSVLVFGTT